MGKTGSCRLLLLKVMRRQLESIGDKKKFLTSWVKFWFARSVLHGVSSIGRHQARRGVSSIEHASQGKHQTAMDEVRSRETSRGSKTKLAIEEVGSRKASEEARAMRIVTTHLKCDSYNDK